MKALFVTLVLGGAVTACGGHAGGEYTVARGSSGRVPATKGTCTSASKNVTVEEGQHYTAHDAGDARVECGDETYTYHVREVARIALTSRAVGDAGYVRVTLAAFDEQGTELDVHDGTKIEWQYADSLERLSCQGDILPSCDQSFQVSLRPTAAGDHRVTARFAGREATINLDKVATASPPR